MRSKLVALWWGLVALMAGLLSVARAEPAAPPEPLVTILELHGSPLIPPGAPPPYAAVLERQGLRVGFPSSELHDRTLTWERLKQFHVLFIPHLPEAEGINGPNVNLDTAHLTPLLERFLEEGGGILYIGQPILSQLPFHEETNKWFKQFGLQMEWATIEDPDHTYANPPKLPFQRQRYVWTTNVAESPLTAGVKTLFYGNDMYYTPTIRPLQLSPEWQVLVRAMPSAKVVPLNRPPLNEIVKTIPEQARQEAAPLFAVRQVGKGRLAVLAADPGLFWFDLGKPALGAVVSANGDGERKPDWLPLLRQVCVWLSEPARTSGKLGRPQPPTQFIIRPDYGHRNPIDWEAPDIALEDETIHANLGMHSGWSAKDFRQLLAGRYGSYTFLVGAHSGASGGQGTVAEWRAAAQAAGFHGVVFREDILKLSREQWAAFEAECQAASDATFLAVPGQQFTEWEGNTFMRFAGHIPYPTAARLSPDGKVVRDQLSFFFDAGHPCNFPLFVRGNPTPWWSYRVHYGWPVALYSNGKLIEDNEATWREQVWRFQYPTPLGVHLLESPAEVAAARDGLHLRVLAPSLDTIRTSPRYQRSLGTGEHNSMAAYASNGPTIDAALPLNMYRATLGSRGVPGSYRWRFYLRAHSDVPITQVELWGDGQLLRRYQPRQTQVLLTVDELHDRQRALLVRVVDARGRVAMGTSFMVHDKTNAFYWCGDQCNTLPYGQGTDAAGNPAGYGIGTHVRLKYSGGGGPGAGFYEAWQYIPSGTDTSIPGLNFWGRYQLHTAGGILPAAEQHLVPDTRFWYASPDAMIQEDAMAHWADLRVYTPKEYGHGYLSAWGRYFKLAPLPDFTIRHHDVDFHRDAAEPGLQLCRGELRFVREVTAKAEPQLNFMLGQNVPWVAKQQGFATATQQTPKDGKFASLLGAGGWLTLPDSLGHGTVYGLDDAFAATAQADPRGETHASWGLALGARTFGAGAVLPYRYLIVRWPLGTDLTTQPEARLARYLRLGPGGDPVPLTLTKGKLVNAQLTLDVELDDYVAQGTLAKVEAPMLRLPVRLRGLNPNWVGGVWYPGKALLAAVTPDPEGWAWLSLDPATEAGPVTFGNLLTCDEEVVVLRLLQRLDGGWIVLAHNPTAKAVSTTVRGTAGGPAAGFKEKAKLAPGAEQRWTLP